MRHFLVALATIAALTVAGVPAASAAVNFDSGPASGPPPAKVGPYTMTKLSKDTRWQGMAVSSVDSPLGSIRFGLPVTHYRTGWGGDWPGWSFGPPTDVYFTGLTQSSMTILLPEKTGAIDFYGQPEAAGTFTLTALSDGEVIGSVSARWPFGPKYFGFWAPLTQSIDALVITAPEDAYGFAVGSIRIARGTDPGPFLTSLSRSSGSTAGGDSLMIRGENFTDGTGVLFGDTPASSVTVVNSTTLEVVTPAHAAGGYDITVVDHNGSSPQVDADAFTFVDAG
jgi:hypothetical protein